jgi:hypothetical protein
MHYTDGTLTKADIETVARETVASLSSCGFQSCLVGGAACMTYGTTRVPNVSFEYYFLAPIILLNDSPTRSVGHRHRCTEQWTDDRRN